MRERLESVAGRCVIESVQGKGTTVGFVIPVRMGLRANV
jgi:signal transduction histidine kinase